MVYGISLSYFLCLPEARFLNVEINPGPRRPVPAVCRILCSDVRGLAGNLSDLTVASCQYYILLCSETLLSDMRHVSELLVPGFGRLVLLYPGKMPRDRGMAAYVRDGYGAFPTQIWAWFLRNAGFWSLWCVHKHKLIFVFSLYRNPGLDDWIFYCLLASLAAVQAEDVRAAFLSVGD